MHEECIACDAYTTKSYITFVMKKKFICRPSSCFRVLTQSRICIAYKVHIAHRFPSRCTDIVDGGFACIHAHNSILDRISQAPTQPQCCWCTNAQLETAHITNGLDWTEIQLIVRASLSSGLLPKEFMVYEKRTTERTNEPTSE